jgi:hypothetical protein
MLRLLPHGEIEGWTQRLAKVAKHELWENA